MNKLNLLFLASIAHLNDITLVENLNWIMISYLKHKMLYFVFGLTSALSSINILWLGKSLQLVFWFSKGVLVKMPES